MSDSKDSYVSEALVGQVSKWDTCGICLKQKGDNDTPYRNHYQNYFKWMDCDNAHHTFQFDKSPLRQMVQLWRIWVNNCQTDQWNAYFNREVAPDPGRHEKLSSSLAVLVEIFEDVAEISRKVCCFFF